MAAATLAGTYPAIQPAPSLNGRKPHRFWPLAVIIALHLGLFYAAHNGLLKQAVQVALPQAVMVNFILPASTAQPPAVKTVALQKTTPPTQPTLPAIQPKLSAPDTSNPAPADPPSISEPAPSLTLAPSNPSPSAVPVPNETMTPRTTACRISRTDTLLQIQTIINAPCSMVSTVRFDGCRLAPLCSALFAATLIGVDRWPTFVAIRILMRIVIIKIYILRHLRDFCKCL